MTVLEIITLPGPVLRRKARAVSKYDDDLQTLIDNMIETMRAAPGVGLAAPQVGVSQRVIVVEYPEDDTYTASLNNPAQTPVTVTLSNGAVISIAADASSGSVSVAAPSDDVYVDAGSVSATIASTTGGNFENLAINPAAAATTISDTIDVTTVSLTASPSVAEGGNIVYTANLTNIAQTPVSVTLSALTMAWAISSCTAKMSSPVRGYRSPTRGGCRYPPRSTAR